MRNLKEYLSRMRDMDASDILIVSGSPVSIRVNKDLIPAFEDDAALKPDDARSLIRQLYESAGRTEPSRQKSVLGAIRPDDDFSFSVPGLARFRTNVYNQRGSDAAAIRIVPFGVPDPHELGIPESVLSVADIRSGLVLITGTTGSGKSTTQACIVDRINETRRAHVVTLEDPIEFLHKNKKSIVSQREIGLDAPDYLSALRSCLRQTPDVILLGEMRDPETIWTALTAAETGHLVIATLHTKTAATTVNRVVDSFPGVQQEQVRVQLASVLSVVVSQQLVPNTSGSLSAAFEIMKANTAIQNLIRENHIHQIDNAILAGRPDGMLTMAGCLSDMLSAGTISKDVYDAAIRSTPQFSGGFAH